MIDTSARIEVDDFIQETPDEPQNLLERTLEESEKIYHKCVAKFQVAQCVLMQEMQYKLFAWARKKLQEGYDDAGIDLAVAKKIGEARKFQHNELFQVMQQLANETDMRNASIHLWYSHRLPPTT